MASGESHSSPRGFIGDSPASNGHVKRVDSIGKVNGKMQRLSVGSHLERMNHDSLLEIHEDSDIIDQGRLLANGHDLHRHGHLPSHHHPSHHHRHGMGRVEILRHSNNHPMSVVATQQAGSSPLSSKQSTGITENEMRVTNGSSSSSSSAKSSHGPVPNGGATSSGSSGSTTTTTSTTIKMNGHVMTRSPHHTHTQTPIPSSTGQQPRANGMNGHHPPPPSQMTRYPMHPPPPPSSHPTRPQRIMYGHNHSHHHPPPSHPSPHHLHSRPPMTREMIEREGGMILHAAAGMRQRAPVHPIKDNRGTPNGTGGGGGPGTNGTSGPSSSGGGTTNPGKNGSNTGSNGPGGGGGGGSAAAGSGPRHTDPLRDPSTGNFRAVYSCVRPIVCHKTNTPFFAQCSTAKLGYCTWCKALRRGNQKQGSICMSCGERLTAKYHKWYPDLVRLEPLEKKRTKQTYIDFKRLFNRFGIVWHDERQLDFVVQNYMLMKIYVSDPNFDVDSMHLERTYMIGVFAGREFNTGALARKLLREGCKLVMFRADFPEYFEFLRPERAAVAERLNVLFFKGTNRCYFHAHHTNIEGWFDPNIHTREHINENFKSLCQEVLRQTAQAGVSGHRRGQLGGTSGGTAGAGGGSTGTGTIGTGTNGVTGGGGTPGGIVGSTVTNGPGTLIGGVIGRGGGGGPSSMMAVHAGENGGGGVIGGIGLNGGNVGLIQAASVQAQMIPSSSHGGIHLSGQRSQGRMPLRQMPGIHQTVQGVNPGGMQIPMSMPIQMQGTGIHPELQLHDISARSGAFVTPLTSVPIQQGSIHPSTANTSQFVHQIHSSQLNGGGGNYIIDQSQPSPPHIQAPPPSSQHPIMIGGARPPSILPVGSAGGQPDLVFQRQSTLEELQRQEALQQRLQMPPQLSPQMISHQPPFFGSGHAAGMGGISASGLDSLATTPHIQLSDTTAFPFRTGGTANATALRLSTTGPNGSGGGGTGGSRTRTNGPTTTTMAGGVVLPLTTTNSPRLGLQSLSGLSNGVNKHPVIMTGTAGTTTTTANVNTSTLMAPTGFISPPISPGFAMSGSGGAGGGTFSFKNPPSYLVSPAGSGMTFSYAHQPATTSTTGPSQFLAMPSHFSYDRR